MKNKRETMEWQRLSTNVMRTQRWDFGEVEKGLLRK
jgi:hypothetical protein